MAKSTRKKGGPSKKKKGTKIQRDSVAAATCKRLQHEMANWSPEPLTQALHQVVRGNKQDLDAVLATIPKRVLWANASELCNRLVSFPSPTAKTVRHLLTNMTPSGQMQPSQDWHDIKEAEILSMTATLFHVRTGCLTMEACTRCKTKNVTYRDAITKASDEAMSTSCICLNCGKTWLS